MQSAYGTAVAFARVHGPDGPVWSAPAYLYVVSQSTGVGFGTPVPASFTPECINQHAHGADWLVGQVVLCFN